MTAAFDEIEKLASGSPWRNAYWFARMLLNSDKYGAAGNKKERHLIEIANRLEAILANRRLSQSEKIKVCRDSLKAGLTDIFRPGTQGYTLSFALATDLETEISTVADVAVFIFTMKYIVAPMNAAISNVPSNDAEFCRGTAKTILDSLGETAVGKVVSTWDTMGVNGCLTVERNIVVAEFTKLRSTLNALRSAHSELEDNMVLTAFIQEFERRLGQKRKNRAGQSLEDVSTFLFDYYGFKSHPKPDHFQTDIEVDKWFKRKDGWTIGISCKRTLRERWKQVSSADSHALSRYILSSRNL